MSIIKILKERLLGNSYSLFRVGDNFDLHFDGFWLISHNLVSPDEEKLNMHILEVYSPASEAIDKEYLAKSVVLSSTLSKCITDVALLDDSSLELTFENGVKLTFPTNTKVVDWQWALNEDANDPYLGCIVGVLASGEVELGVR